MRIVTSDEFGTIAAAVDDSGEIVATCADSIRDGVYMAVDEAEVWRLTGQLLPSDLWDHARRA
jgi:hypothetical protein